MPQPTSTPLDGCMDVRSVRFALSLSPTPESRTMRDFRHLGREARKPEDRRATFPADEPRIEIDFIVAGPRPEWRIDEVEVIEETTASDHRPVVATLRPWQD